VLKSPLILLSLKENLPEHNLKDAVTAVSSYTSERFNGRMWTAQLGYHPAL